MRSFLVSTKVCLASFFAIAFCSVALSAEAPRETISLDRDWRFHLGEVADGQAVTLDDSAWRRLNVPHDWSIEGPGKVADTSSPSASFEGPFNKNSPAGPDGGYLDGGIGWYRRTIALPPAAKNRRVAIEFDGAYMDSEVWLNGTLLGEHPYGYTGFEFDLTPHLKWDGPNVLAVRLNVTQPCSRWYSGAGIFRHVRLTLTDPVHVAHWGTYVTTPKVAADAATVQVVTRITNQGDSAAEVRLETIALDPVGAEVAKGEAKASLAAGDENAFEQSLRVSQPKLWSIETPQLCTVVSQVYVGDRLADRYTTNFGIRTFEFTRDRGFFLNGRHVSLQAVCLHHDLGCLGAAVSRRAIQRQLEILKGMGCNAIRTSHNPPAPELLELCDRLGLVVMDEAFDEWKTSKMKFGYGRFFDEWSERDLVSMINRDRNHPCVVMWSIGNEIREQGAPNGGAMAKRLSDICHREDPSRPTTSACSNPTGAVKSGFAKAIDLFGINYLPASYQKLKGAYTLLGSETASKVNTRGEYNLVTGADGKVELCNRYDDHVTPYNSGKPRWLSTPEPELLAVRNAPWVAGEFVWTGFDYIGEPKPYPWPARSSIFGIIDLAGFPKDRYYFYRSVWRPEPLVHLMPHWNWPGYEGKEIPVWAVTNCDAVELFLDGKSLGEQKLDREKALHVEWRVPYAPGLLKAVGKKGNQVVCTDEVRTVGKPVRLTLKADRARIAADGDDLSFVTVQVVDADGLVCPDASNLVRFRISGPGAIAGVDNGDPTNIEPFKADRHKVFHGLGLAVLKAAGSPGRITLHADADGLAPAEIVVETAPTP